MREYKHSTCLSASCQEANHKLFGFPHYYSHVARYLLCICYSEHGIEHLKYLILCVLTPCFLLDYDGFTMNIKNVVFSVLARKKKR